MKITCIIVEDEPLAQERIRDYIEKISFLDLLAVFDKSIDALAYLRSQPVDLIFLDINLGELSGLQFLETAKPESSVIITTAYHDYALKGFELNVTDYLLKPFTFERFLTAVNKVKTAGQKPELLPEKKYIFIKTEYRLEKVLFSDLLYIEGMRDYRRVHTKNKKLMTLQTFRDFEEEIPEHVLCRVHKSYMVAPDKIDSVERDRIKILDTLIPISDTYRKAFFKLINRPSI